ncbi:hypothetical protein C8R21_10952 [Nitrosospira multiformis]|uniref:Uncharacterized protein n=1 Tax=Nitrosospira multiformis TaxID=1231 RepID=A0A2T5ICL7_9PROT|nr:hypothetical protein C8R21_10952 [Nitrosospira multiformis]
MARFGRTTLAVVVLKLKDRTNSSPWYDQNTLLPYWQTTFFKEIRKACRCIEISSLEHRSTDLLLAIYVTPASATLLFFPAYLQYKNLLNSPLDE